jgi:hypothetical protein
MSHLLNPFWRRLLPLLAILLTGAVVLTGTPSNAQKPPVKPPVKPSPPPPPPEAKPAPRTARLTSEAWNNAPMTPIRPGEIDTLVSKELQQSKVLPAPLTTDEQFIRRATLDLTGRPPTPAEVSAFAANTDRAKRAKLIDKLLDSEAFGQHWARYWRDVITAKIVDRRGLIGSRAFEEWMTGELNRNVSWDRIVKAILTADGGVRFDKPTENGPAFFLLAHTGPDAANDRAAETSRVFLGIQIQCAQCHDHPFDQWKQVQFHELAGYFARLRERPIRENMKVAGFELFSTPQGEHQMADKTDPKKVSTTYPHFLDGKAAPKNTADRDRRLALANSVVDRNNYWFAGAFVNRMWGELMGQSFYQPVDDMGPLKEAVFPDVLVRLAAAFRANHYDVKDFFRVVMNTQTYQRQIRLGDSSDQHLHFAASYPKRLSADAIWESLVNVLGPIGPPKGFPPPGPAAAAYGVRFGLEGQFKQLFEFDPSLRADEVEGSIPQALMLMNNPQINQRMKAGGAFLARVLKEHVGDDEALQALYVQTLSRRPTAAELEKCRKYIAKVGSRGDAYEDILWALINSTEFQTKR